MSTLAKNGFGLQAGNRCNAMAKWLPNVYHITLIITLFIETIGQYGTVCYWWFCTRLKVGPSLLSVLFKDRYANAVSQQNGYKVQLFIQFSTGNFVRSQFTESQFHSLTSFASQSYVLHSAMAHGSWGLWSFSNNLRHQNLV